MTFQGGVKVNFGARIFFGGTGLESRLNPLGENNNDPKTDFSASFSSH
jgi:hypothetical protein